MYLSQLLIDVGGNPDRPRPGRLWLRNIYHVHQRLLMAFPNSQKRAADEFFVARYKPEDFHRPRVLFRVDHAVCEDEPRRIILVLSDAEPDWEYGFANTPMLLMAQCRQYAPAHSAGTALRFRILANPSVTSREHRKPVTKQDGRAGDQGKRVSLVWKDGQEPKDVVLPWFGRCGERNGFELDMQHTELVRLGWVSGYRKRDDRTMRWRSALIEGRLRVRDDAKFNAALAHGMGSAKAFGFGLLSVAAV